MAKAVIVTYSILHGEHKCEDCATEGKDSAAYYLTNSGHNVCDTHLDKRIKS